MVRAVEEHNKKEFARILNLNPSYGTAILANYEAYGDHHNHENVWLVYNWRAKPHMVVELFRETLTVCCDEEDDNSEILAAFLSIAPYWRRLVGPRRLVHSLPQRILRGKQLMSGSVMKLELPPPATAHLREGETLTTEPELAQIFKLLCECSEDYRKRADYSLWLTDISYRMRHGGAYAAAVKADGLYVSCAFGYCAGQNAVVRDVCTLPDRRGKGYGGAVVGSLTDALAKQGKTPYLMSVSPQADALYQKAGYRPYSAWAAFEQET